MSGCKCTMREAVVGDGCEICNPTMALEVARDALEEAKASITELESRIHEACEIYTGMDGFIPETAPEGYQQRILRQMYKALLGGGE